MRAALDWRTLLMGLPRRRFTAAELALAQPEPLTPSLRLVALLNGLPTLGMLLALAGPRNPWPYSAVALGLWLALFAALATAWRNPSQPWVRRAYYGLPLLTGLAVGLMARRLHGTQPTDLALLTAAVMVGVLALWFVILYRHQHIAARLREKQEQARALALARQLATAQIQPHFLFNTLAAVQHWVATRDARAAPLLDALTGYLRATLPLFERERLTLAEELQAVRRYLEVMQARLGPRLAFAIDLPPALAVQRLPPGALLTLAENAIEHGVQPQLAGGRVRVAVWREGPLLHARVADDGPGAPPALLGEATPDPAHLGLANTRARLAAVGGRLTLTNRLDGGCAATVTWPHEESPPCAP